MSSQWVMVVKDARDALTVSSEISIANQSASDINNNDPDAWAYLRDLSSYFAAGSVGATSLKVTVQDGVVPATATITLSGFVNGDTITVDGIVFTGRTTPDAPTDFKIGASDTITAANFVAVLNAATNPAIECLVMSSSSAAVITLTSLIPGPIGNFQTATISAHGVITSPGNGPAANATLLTAATYGVLAQSAITNTGNTIVQGDFGISPNTLSSVTGWTFSTSPGPGIATGTKHFADSAAAQAHTDASAAAVTLKATSVDTDISAVDLGGYTAVPGHYKASAAGTWGAGPLTLNGAGTYIFEFVTSLTTPSGATVILANGATANNVYFITGTAFTFGANNTFYGNVMAGSAVTFASNSVLNGRAMTYGVSGTAVTFPSAGLVNVPNSNGGFGNSNLFGGGTSSGCADVEEGIGDPLS